MGTIRWGMIGTGSVARLKSGPAFSLAGGSELAAVSSRTPDSARSYAQAHGVPMVFPTPIELIRSADVDAVYIATPPASHVPLALEVARAGKPCCIEKPMAVFHEDAQAALRAFEAIGIPLFVSYYRRSLPRFRHILDWIARGEIGTVRSVEWRLSRPPALGTGMPGWRTNPDEAPGGLFEDLGCHGLDLFDFLIGPVSAVHESRLVFSRDAEVPHAVEASWQHGPAIEGHGRWDFAAAERGDTATIAGARGRIHFSVFDESPIVLEAEHRRDERRIANPVPIQLHHVEAMVSHLNGESSHPSTARSAIRTAWVTEQILRGATTAKLVR